MSKHRHGGRQKSYGGSAGGGRGGGGGGGNKQGKILYNSGDEPSFIRQFKERTGYKAPATAEDKVRRIFYYFVQIYLYIIVVLLLFSVIC